jgi:hypothetical protein
MKGYIGALLELILFFYIFGKIVDNTSLSHIESVTCYWLGFTVLTGLWEIVYLTGRKYVNAQSTHLIQTKSHVWTNDYDFSMVFPWNFSKLFYSEYGAWADREYMFYKDNWSLTVEGTHCTMCGFFSLCALVCMLYNHEVLFLMTLMLGMGAQLMNSILYLEQYWVQCSEQSSVNFNNQSFPCGKYLMGRAFMWINLLWIVMPTYALCVYLLKEL